MRGEAETAGQEVERNVALGGPEIRLRGGQAAGNAGRGPQDECGDVGWGPVPDGQAATLRTWHAIWSDEICKIPSPPYQQFQSQFYNQRKQAHGYQDIT